MAAEDRGPSTPQWIMARPIDALRTAVRPATGQGLTPPVSLTRYKSGGIELMWVKDLLHEVT
jgi:hypothetical protein